MGIGTVGEGGSKLRSVVKPLVFFCRHLALLARGHLFSRQATRSSDILYTYSVVAFGPKPSTLHTFALSWRSHNKRHELYLITSLEIEVRQARAIRTAF